VWRTHDILTRMYPPLPCNCFNPDPAAALASVRSASHHAQLVDESHFGVSLRKCEHSPQWWICFFCETVDWADGDDPQAFVAVPIDELERTTLASLQPPVQEAVLLQLVSRPRSFLLNNRPKGAPSTTEWRTAPPFIPAHD
jgi:hypothetical protein